MMWIVLTITLISHIGLIIIFEQHRKKLESLRSVLRRQKNMISHLESQVRMNSKRLFR